MIFVLAALTSILLGLSLIAIGGFLWLAAKKMIPGIILLAVGLIFTSVPIASFAYFMIVARG